MEAYVKALDLGSGTQEMLKPEETFNPLFHRLHQILTERIVDPDQITHKYDTSLSSNIEQNPDIFKRASDTISKLKLNFSLKKMPQRIKATKRKYWGDYDSAKDGRINVELEGDKRLKMKVEGNYDVDIKTFGDLFDDKKIVTKVGMVKPLEDFNSMLSQGDINITINAICSLKKVIDLTIQSGKVYYCKAMSYLQAMRVACVETKNKSSVLLFNDYIRHVKTVHENGEHSLFWSEFVVSRNVSLISSDEVSCSDINPEASRDFIRILPVISKSTHQLDTIMKNQNEDDLFDEM